MSDERLREAAEQVIREFGASAGNIYRVMLRENCSFKQAKAALDAVAAQQKEWRKIS